MKHFLSCLYAVGLIACGDDPRETVLDSGLLDSATLPDSGLVADGSPNDSGELGGDSATDAAFADAGGTDTGFADAAARSCVGLMEGEGRCAGEALELCEEGTVSTVECGAGRTCDDGAVLGVPASCSCDFRGDGVCAPGCESDPDCSTTTGVGSSLEVCNGVGRLTLDGPSVEPQQWDVAAVWVYGRDPVVGLANTIFGYSRPQIDSNQLPLVGTPGEIQIRIALPATASPPAPGDMHAGIVLVSEWDAGTERWVTIQSATANFVTYVSIETDEAAFSAGSWCAGLMRGWLRGIVDGGGDGFLTIDMPFIAPLLTPRFPN